MTAANLSMTNPHQSPSTRKRFRDTSRFPRRTMLGLSIAAILTFASLKGDAAQLDVVAYHDMPTAGSRLGWFQRRSPGPQPVLGNSGHVVFQAELAAPEVTVGGLWRFSPGSSSLEPVYQEYDLTVDKSGSTIPVQLGGYFGEEIYSKYGLSPRGDVVFTKHFMTFVDAGINSGAYRYSSGQLKEIAREGSRFHDFYWPDVNQAGIGPNGEWAFQANTFANPGGVSLFVQQQGEPKAVAWSGRPLPDSSGVFGSGPYQRPYFLDDGTVRFEGITSLLREGLFEYKDDELSEIFAPGTTLDGQKVVASEVFELGSGRYAMHVAFEGNAYRDVYAVSETGYQHVFSDGDAAPSINAMLQTYGGYTNILPNHLHANNTGVFNLQLPGETGPLFHFDDDGISLVARNNLLVGPALDQELRNFELEASNDSGLVFMSATIAPLDPFKSTYESFMVWDSSMPPVEDLREVTASRPQELFRYGEYIAELQGVLRDMEVLGHDPQGDMLVKVAVDTSQDGWNALASFRPEDGFELIARSGYALTNGTVVGSLHLNNLQVNDSGHMLFEISEQGTGVRQILLYGLEDRIPGDFNGDGVVDGADYTVWRDAEGSTGAGIAADANRDNSVDSLDYAIWRQNFGQGNTTASVDAGLSVPEPGSAVLFASVLVFIFAAKINRNPVSKSMEP